MKTSTPTTAQISKALMRTLEKCAEGPSAQLRARSRVRRQGLVPRAGAAVRALSPLSRPVWLWRVSDAAKQQVLVGNLASLLERADGMEIAVARTMFIHAKKRTSDGALLIETTNGDLMHEALVGPGQHTPATFATARVSKHKQGLGLFAIELDVRGIMVRP